MRVDIYTAGGFLHRVNVDAFQLQKYLRGLLLENMVCHDGPDVISIRPSWITSVRFNEQEYKEELNGSKHGKEAQ